MRSVAGHGGADWMRMLRFGAIGAFNTLWSYLLFAGLTYLGLGLVLASLLTIVISVGVGYLTQGSLVFGNMSRSAWWRFVMVWVVIYLAYLGVVSAGHAMGLSSYVGGLIATPVVAALSYLLQSRFVFVAGPDAGGRHVA